MIIQHKQVAIEVTKEDNNSGVIIINTDDTFYQGNTFSSVRILSSITEENIKEVVEFLQSFHPCLIKIK